MRSHDVCDMGSPTTASSWAHVGESNDAPVYRIAVNGVLSETTRCAFPGLVAEARGGETLLHGPIADQAALFGVLARIEALGLELLEVQRLSP